MRKKILITGGLGFIGTNLINLLETDEFDYEYYIIDKVNYASLDNALMLKSNKRLGFQAKKVSEMDFSLLSEIDYIIHLAAESSVDLSIRNPGLFMENVTELQSLLEACRSYPNIKKIICVGTDEEYGCFSQTPEKGWEESWDTSLKPNSPYSSSKASASLVARSYWRTFNLPIVVTRCANNYGPFQNEEKFIPTIVRKLSLGQKVPIYGSGTNIREWIHAEDHSKGLLRAMEFGNPGSIYHFSGEALTNFDLICCFLETLGFDRKEDHIEFVEDRKAHDFIYKLDDKKTRDTLDWAPTRNIREDIKHLIESYR